MITNVGIVRAHLLDERIDATQQKLDGASAAADADRRAHVLLHHGLRALPAQPVVNERLEQLRGERRVEEDDAAGDENFA